MLHEQMIEEIERLVEDACKSDSNAFGYGIWSHHIVYVVKCAKQLAEKLSADSEIVEIAALLHDYAGIKDCMLAEEHHIYGAVEAERILIEFNYPKDRIEKVKDCIITHRGSVPMKRLTQEAECIASADAMTHIFQVPSLLHLAYVTHGMGIDEGKEWVLKKIERSMNKLCPEAKEMVQDHYLKVKEVLI
ncbi:MAG: HD domain-containing protein [Clostridium sp.]|uniref:HD domain-containing protein n=1 Tax=Clostridium sp. TaxID=1506 RepID=UPI0032174593